MKPFPRRKFRRGRASKQPINIERSRRQPSTKPHDCVRSVSLRIRSNRALNHRARMRLSHRALVVLDGVCIRARVANLKHPWSRCLVTAMQHDFREGDLVRHHSCAEPIRVVGVGITIVVQFSNGDMQAFEPCEFRQAGDGQSSYAPSRSSLIRSSSSASSANCSHCAAAISSCLRLVRSVMRCANALHCSAFRRNHSGRVGMGTSQREAGRNVSENR